MKHNWTRMKIYDLGLLGNLKNGYSFYSGDFMTNGIPVIKIGNLQNSSLQFTENTEFVSKENLEKLKDYLVEEDDVLLAMSGGTTGKISLVKKEHLPAFQNQRVGNLGKLNREKIDERFLLILEPLLKRRLLEQSNGSGQPNISKKTLDTLFLDIPVLEEQKRLISKIEKVKSRLEEINSLRTEQSKDINNLLFSKYTDLIESAEWLPMKEVAPIHRRQVEVNPEETYFEIGVRSFGRGLFENPSFKGSDLTWQKPFWMREGDLLFSNIKAWEGAVGLIPAKYDGWVGSHRYITCLPNLEIIDPEFLYYYFRTFEGVEKLSSASPGTVDRNRTLNNKLLQQIEIPVPSIELQKEFVELLEKTNAIKEDHKQTEKELAELMPSLLDKAFKGEL